VPRPQRHRDRAGAERGGEGRRGRPADAAARRRPRARGRRRLDGSLGHGGTRARRRDPRHGADGRGRGGAPRGVPLRRRARLRRDGDGRRQQQGLAGGDPRAPRSDRRRPGRLRAGLALPETRRELRRDAALPPARDARPSAPLLAGRAPMGHRVDERIPRDPLDRARRPAARSLRDLARRVRARAVPLPARDPARLPDRGGPGEQGVSTASSRPDEDEAGDRLVVDPPPARLRRARNPALTMALLRVAVIGAGHWGPNLIRNFHNKERSEVAWVADTDPGRLAQVRARFAEVRTTADPEEIFADPDVGAVVIATPASTHHRLAKSALERGKHVLVEKPIATDSAHGAELCALAARAGRVLMVGHVFLYNPGIRRVKQYLDDGALGRVYYVSMVRTNLGPIRLDVNAAWDLAAHDVSIVNYWLGSEPATVSAIGGTWINQGVEDAVFATLRYRDNVVVNLHVSWLNPRKSRDITVVR